MSDYTSLAVVQDRPVFVNDPSDVCWGAPGWPSWLTSFRDHQWQAFNDIITAYETGAKVVLLDAPVGSGKTIIAEMVRRWLQAQTLYVCSGKALQDQFVRDFDYAKLLKGRSNYSTADRPNDPTVTAADCDMQRAFLPACDACPSDADGYDNNNDDDEHPHCSECHPVEHCPYRVAKRAAWVSPIACINTSYFLAEINGPGQFSGKPFVVVDECDMLEKEVMSFHEVTISARRRKKYGIDFPKHKTEKAGTRQRFDDEGHTFTEWEVWFAKTHHVVKEARRLLPNRPVDRDERREAKYLDGLLESLALVKQSIADGGWVYTGYDRGEITFKPVVVTEFGQHVLWSHAQKWLLMSGTIIDPTEMVDSLGLPPGTHWELVQVPMTFPKENRPIRILPTAEMSAKTKDVAWPKVAARVAEIAAHHPDERILVHGVSYALCTYIYDRIDPARRITYANAQDREPALARYLAKPAAILVAPSMDRGVDLPGDACRVQVICKLPFPFLGDKQISTRLYSVKGGQQWYQIQCIRSFVQMTGRGVRNDKDHAVTYVLDNMFMNNLYKKAKRLLPSYFDEAIDWSGRLR